MELTLSFSSLITVVREMQKLLDIFLATLLIYYFYMSAETKGKNKRYAGGRFNCRTLQDLLSNGSADKLNYRIYVYFRVPLL